MRACVCFPAYFAYWFMFLAPFCLYGKRLIATYNVVYDGDCREGVSDSAEVKSLTGYFFFLCV